MKRYEYRIEEIKEVKDSAPTSKRNAVQDESLVETLNKLGRQGWRVCHVEKADNSACVKLWLERKLADWNLDNSADD